MLEEKKILAALEKRQEDIYKENEDYRLSKLNLDEMLSNFEKMTKAEMLKEIKLRDLPCIPLKYNIGLRNSVKKFPDISSAKRWAIDQLKGTALASVDGSQVFASKELTFPIALVQAGSFMKIYPNQLSHDQPAQYNFDTAPRILLRSDSASPEDVTLGRAEIGLERQKQEVEHAKILLPKLTQAQKRILILDNTLIYSFLTRAPLELRTDTIKSLLDLLAYCRDFKTSLVGYIDASVAKDFSRMLLSINGIKEAPPTDTYIFKDILTELGDYSPPFLSRRKILEDYVDTDNNYQFTDQLCFSYLRVHSGRPIRIEFPRTIVENGEFHSLMKTILAEAILGDGYPHILTRAHQAAVIKYKDREVFYQIVYHYLSKHNIPVQKNVKDTKKHEFF